MKLTLNVTTPKSKQHYFADIDDVCAFTTWDVFHVVHLYLATKSTVIRFPAADNEGLCTYDVSGSRMTIENFIFKAEKLIKVYGSKEFCMTFSEKTESD